jgi:UV DNA damage endonuclease
MTPNLGYCCINQTLRKQDIYSSRTFIRRNFTIAKASQLALQNVKDILKILHWNEQHNIRVFRIGSEPLPRSNDPEVGYSVNQLPDSQEITDTLKQIGRFAQSHDHHLSFHPGQFVCIGSPKESVRQLGILALERENEVADIICSEYHNHLPINIHVGGCYSGDYVGTASRFINSFKSLSKSLQSRLVVENDDKAACWSVNDLYCYLTSQIDIPITFDIHHWHFRHTADSIVQDFLTAYSTWGTRSAQVHYSESANPNKLITAHSDYYSQPLPDWILDKNVHIHLEAKEKELALQKLVLDFYSPKDIMVGTK